MDNNDFVIVVKLALFVFIVTSPFYNVGSVFSFLDNILAKIVILLLIVAASFADMQLALVAAIAFFILMLHFNTSKVSNKQQVPLVGLAPVDMTFQHAMSDIPRLGHNLETSPIVDIVYPNQKGQMTQSQSQARAQMHPGYDLETISMPPVPIDALPSVEQGMSSAKVMHNMYEFPEVKCKAPVEANDAFMNETMVNYYLDPKIKPYEDFISQLTNEDLLDSVSNGAFLQ